MNETPKYLRAYNRYNGLRPLNAQECEQIKPFYQKGQGEKAHIGILILHGFIATPASFHNYSTSLAKQGYTVYCPALPGHNNHPDDMIGMSWKAWLTGAIKAFERLKSECQEVYIIGQSMGGSLGMHISLAYPEVVKHLILLAPAICPSIKNQLSSPIIPILMALKKKYIQPLEIDMKSGSAFEIRYRLVPLYALHELFRCMRATKKILPKITNDVTIFFSHDDHLLNSSMTPSVVEKLGSKNKELIWVTNSYHVLSQDNDANFIFQQIQNILK